jgi:hypothetical protein
VGYAKRLGYTTANSRTQLTILGDLPPKTGRI